MTTLVEPPRVDATELARAIRRDELYLVFQPAISLASGRIRSAEGLARWHHRRIGPIPPTEFVPLAEDSGLIAELGDAVLRRTVEQATAVARTRAGANGGVVTWCNVSPRQLGDGRFVGLVADVLEEAALPPSAIGLELTESVLTDGLADDISALGQLGVGLAIDDFGTGWSSLASLRRHPFQLLKIDRSFVAGLPHESDDHAIVRTVITLAHSLGLRVIAEGVESVSALRSLRQLGCDEASGFFIARPLSPARLNRLLSADQPLIAPPPATGGSAQQMADRHGTLRVAPTYGERDRDADPGAVEIISNLLSAASRLTRRVDEFMADHDLDAESFNVLMVIEGADGLLTAQEIERRMLTSPRDPVALLDRLIRQDLVVTDDAGRAGLTSRGYSRLADVRTRSYRFERTLTSGLDVADREAWLTLTGRLAAGFDNPRAA